MAYIGSQPTVGNFQACDAITTSATTTFNLLVGGVAISPQSAQHCLVSLNGILQAPISSYTISGSTIVFASALTSADSIDFITILGDTLDLGTPSDGTVATASIAANAVTAAKFNADVISGQTALAAEPADTDEFLVSDAGVLKRIDYSLIKGGGAHTLISTTTVDDDAAAAITGMDSTYSRYLVTINNLKSANDGVTVYMRVIIGGSVQTGSNYPYGNNTRNSGSGAAGNESADATSFKISKSDIGNATGENYSGEITVYNPSETSQFKNIGWRSVYTVSDGTVDSNIGGGFYKSGQAAITGISIFMSGGNITSAVIKLYGIT